MSLRPRSARTERTERRRTRLDAVLEQGIRHQFGGQATVSTIPSHVQQAYAVINPQPWTTFTAPIPQGAPVYGVAVSGTDTITQRRHPFRFRDPRMSLGTRLVACFGVFLESSWFDLGGVHVDTLVLDATMAHASHAAHGASATDATARAAATAAASPPAPPKAPSGTGATVDFFFRRRRLPRRRPRA